MNDESIKFWMRSSEAIPARECAEELKSIAECLTGSKPLSRSSAAVLLRVLANSLDRGLRKKPKLTVVR